MSSVISGCTFSCESDCTSQCDLSAIQGLAVRESGSGDEQLLHSLSAKGTALPTAGELSVSLNGDAEEIEAQLQALCATGKVLEVLPGRYIAGTAFDALWESCRGLLEQYHRQNPLHGGMKEAELRQKLLKSTPQPITDALLAMLVKEGKLRHTAWRYALGDFEVHLTKKQNAIREKLLKLYHDFGLEVPNLEEVMEKFSPGEQQECKRVVESLVTGGALVMLTPQLCLHQEVYQEIAQKTRAHFEAQEELTLADFRDILQSSRKYALAILEYYDKNKILKKEGDLRRKGPAFDAL